MTKITFNGYDLSQLIYTEWEIDEKILPTIEDTRVKIGDTAGEKFIKRQLGIREIVVPYTMIQATQEKRELLTSVLNVSEPKQLIIEDRPNTYYMAIPNGNIEYGKKGSLDRSTITFVASDPYRYAINPVSFDMATDGTIEVQNNGNVPTTVDFTATHSSDNGFLAFVSKDAFIQEGRPNEVDGANSQPNTLMWIKTFNTTETKADFELNKFPSNYQHAPDRLSGNWNYAPGRAGDYRAYPTYAEGTNRQIWYGPSMYRAFTGTPENWRIEISLEVIAKKVQTLGAVEWGVVDAQGNLIAGYRIRKLNYKDKGLELHVLVGSDKSNNVRSKWEGNKTWIIKDFFGHMSIEKDGEWLRMRFENETTSAPWGHSYMVPNQAQAAGFNFWAGSCSPTTRLDVSLFFVRCWNNTVKWVDSKNVFSDRDTLTAVSNDAIVTPYFNGVPTLDLQDPGSQPIIAPPGKSTIRVLWSSFATIPPVVRATLRERWL